MDERSPHDVVLKNLEVLTKRLQLAKEVEPLLQKFKMEKWMALEATATANELVLLALDRIKNQVTDYDVFIKMLKSMPGVEPIAHQMIGECPLLAPEATTSAEPATTDTATDTTQKSAAIVQPSTAAQTLHTTSPLAETGTVTTASSAMPSTTDGTQPLAVTAWSIEKVKVTILELEKRFADLTCDAQLEIDENEKQGRRFLDRFRSHLLLMPVVKRVTHVKFFQEKLDDILAAKTTQKILAIICLYSNYDYRNYEILLHLITRFCGAPLQRGMQEYRKMLEGFEKATTVDVFISAIPPEDKSKELEDSFSKMVVKIDKPSSECRLYEIRKLNEAIIEGSYLNSYSVYVGSVSPNCVVVVFRFPTSAVGWVLAAMTPNFMTTHLLTSVTVDGECLTVVKAERDELNRQLHDASEAGDVARATSLLNSGADMEAVGGEYSATPLDTASEYGSLHVVRLLLQRGAKMECRDKDGWTPLITAAVHGHRDVVIELLDNGADINAQSNVTQLHISLTWMVCTDESSLGWSH
jgi:hypothetical protein